MTASSSATPARPADGTGLDAARPVPRARTAPPTSHHRDAPVATYAHRGASGMAPENTAAAFELAIAEGADCIETDVQLSADGELVIIHDVTLTRTTDARQAFPDRAPWHVHDFTLTELKTLDAGAWYDDDFAGQRILTLDELLDLLSGRIHLNLELKSPEVHPGLAEAVAARLRRYPEWIEPAAPAHRLIVGSFDEQAVRDFAARLPDVPVSLIAYDVPTSEKLAELTGWVDSVNPDIRRLQPDDATRVFEAGMALVPWTIDSPQYWQWAVDLGVDGVITNYPYALKNVLHGRDPLPDAASVVIEDIAYRVSGDALRWRAGEHVVLRNVTDQPVDVSGWYLRDQASHKIVVGEGYVIPPGRWLRVHTGPGDNDADSYHNGRTAAVWSDTRGNSAALHRADDAIVHLYAYIA